tara:strand:+ start:39 stop:1415 length:1377 start_codon:yes stop_codon:yes gene_type:complete
MKVQVQSKKGLKTILSIVIDKETIQKKLSERLLELQKEVTLKGFRPGKVPSSVIKKQFGKAVYGDVIDKLLKDSSSSAIKSKNIKVAGQPKIDLKVFGEGKDLNYTLEVDSFPEVKLHSFENLKITEYKVKIDSKIIEDKLKEIASQHKIFKDRKSGEKSKIGDQIIFDYSATSDGKKFEGSEGKGVQIELGKDLFLKGFDEQLVGLNVNQIKKVNAVLPANHPKKELANKKTIFDCKILKIQSPEKTLINDELSKNLGAKDLPDLKNLIEKQISAQYKQALDSITKKEILEQLEKLHSFNLPSNLVDNEISIMTQNLKAEEKNKHKESNLKLAKSRIKLGLILNEFGEKNNLKISEEEIKIEIQKQVKGMPGQEKMIFDYYQKNPAATQNLKGSLYEEKIINHIKSIGKILKKEVNSKEAENIISKFNKISSQKKEPENKTESSRNIKPKSKKISKK